MESNPPSEPPPPRKYAARLQSTGLPEVDIEEPLNSDFPVVSEDTDLSTLSPHDIFELNQEMIVDSVDSRPLIDEISPMTELRKEYENGSTSFVAQIDWLTSQGFDSIRRARGDGNCFYRSFAFAYVESIRQSPDPTVAVANSLSILESTLFLLKKADFQELVFEGFYEPFRDLVLNIDTPDDAGDLLTAETLLQALQDAQLSNSICMYLRLVTSAQIQLNSAEYEPFLTNLSLLRSDRPVEFCQKFVEVAGVEADHVQIVALCTALKTKVKVAYLSGRSNDLNFAEIGEGENEPLYLLYRPGHYDILGRNQKSSNAMVEG